jgi:DNA (cytosine-5)-methyltransferase 1
MYRHLSLFSGCGGMDLGVRGGFLVNKSFLPQADISDTQFLRLPETGFKCVFANDIKKSAQKFWLRNHLSPADRENFVCKSIVDLVKEEKSGRKIFPENIDLVTGGFPCQDFSVSGLRKGFDSHKTHRNDISDLVQKESRGMLYLWMKKVISITRPKIFIAENVSGLGNLGNALETIKTDFANTAEGYAVFARQLNAPDYGIPQSRRRIFFIGLDSSIFGSDRFDEDDLFPKKTHIVKNDLFSDIHSLEHCASASNFFVGLREPEEEDQDRAQQSFSKAKYGGQYQGQTEVDLTGIAPTIRSEHHGNIEYRRLSAKRGGKNKSELAEGMKERRLTVRECARIQTFPDDFDFVFDDSLIGNLSASASYKLIGDAVPPLLAYHIAIKIRSLLERDA